MITKIVMKGFKEKEYEKIDILKNFKKIINNNQVNLIIERTNTFKRNLIKLLAGTQKMNIIPRFPFNKRVKIIKNNKWVKTEALSIRIIRK